MEMAQRKGSGGVHGTAALIAGITALYRFNQAAEDIEEYEWTRDPWFLGAAAVALFFGWQALRSL